MPKPKPIAFEHEEQAALIEWWGYARRRWNLPDFALYAIPNAGAGAQRGQAGKLKAEGVRPGVPDLFLAVPRMNRGDSPKHGLFIEMKRMQGGKISTEQRDVIEFLSSQGYAVRVCYGCTQAIEAITEYLS